MTEGSDGWGLPESLLQRLIRKHRNIDKALYFWQLETFGPSRRSGFFDENHAKE